MKSRLVRLGVLLVAVLGLMATSTPAEATITIKKITFVGRADLIGGLGYPCTNTTTPPADTTKCPVIGVGNHRNFSATTTFCVKLSIGAKGKTGIDNCAIVADGTVWGWCGLSSGLGTASLINLGPVTDPLGSGGKALITFRFHFVGVGGELVITGGDGPTTAVPGPEELGLHPVKVTGPGTTNVSAVVTAIPDVSPGGPSCTNKTGTGFTLVGEAVAEV